jgi:hypothetical protein
MTIEIHDTALEARLQKQIQSTGAASAEEALQRILETQEEQDRWLLENKEAINVKVKRGIEQLDRGEGIPEDQSAERGQSAGTGNPLVAPIQGREASRPFAGKRGASGSARRPEKDGLASGGRWYSPLKGCPIGMVIGLSYRRRSDEVLARAL